MRTRLTGLGLTLLLLTSACGHDDAIGPDVGASCASNNECSQRCLGVTDPGDYPGGFCTLACATDADCSNGSICMRKSGGVCLLPCTITNNCTDLGAGWRCKNSESNVGGGERQVCLGD